MFLSLLQAADTVTKVASDSVAHVVGTTTGTQVELLLLSGFGLLNKFITDGAQKLLGAETKLPAVVQSVIALVFAQGIVFLNAKVGLSLSPDVNALAVSAQGLVVWATSMGWHSLVTKVVKPKA